MTMRVFDRQGAYPFLLSCNMLLHQEATRYFTTVLVQWIQRRAKGAPASSQDVPLPLTVTLLDVACGGAPVSVCGALGQFPDVRFEYTGVDINADQLLKLRAFAFPPNVALAAAVKGCAWSVVEALRTHGCDPVAKYDVVFMGLNTHHGSVEQVYQFILQLRVLLTPEGFFFNHDLFRTCGPYEPRPVDSSSSSSTHSPSMAPSDFPSPFKTIDDIYRFMRGSGSSHEDLNLRMVHILDTGGSSSFRAEYIHRFMRELRAKGCAEEEALAEVQAHITAWDYPLSAAELQAMFTHARFSVCEAVCLCDSDEELRDLYGVLVATLSCESASAQ